MLTKYSLSIIGANVAQMSNCVRRCRNGEGPLVERHGPVSPLDDWDDTRRGNELDDLRDYLLALGPATVYCLAAVAAIGEGVFPGWSRSGFGRVVKQTRERFPRHDEAVSNLLRQGDLPECLTMGLDELRRVGVEIDEYAGVDVDQIV